jgi:hypothetical protein
MGLAAARFGPPPAAMLFHLDLTPADVERMMRNMAKAASCER